MDHLEHLAVRVELALLDPVASREWLDRLDREVTEDLAVALDRAASLDVLVLLDHLDWLVTLGQQVRWVDLVLLEQLVLRERGETPVLEVSRAFRVFLEFLT